MAAHAAGVPCAGKTHKEACAQGAAQNLEEIRKLGQNLGRLDAEHRHKLRKALKNLRYQAEFFAPLFGRRDAHRFIERLKTLQDVFGYINDVRMAPGLVDAPKWRPDPEGYDTGPQGVYAGLGRKC